MTDGADAAGPLGPNDIDSSVSHSARVTNYWLGGKDHYPIDRQIGEDVRQALPQIVDLARADRDFLRRAVTFLTRTCDVRQFLDVGTGMPTANNTHQVAQALAPESRIVYVDNDPLVLAHATALLTSAPEGAADYVHADLRDPETILERAGHTLDFTHPVGLTLLGVVEHLPDDGQASDIVDRLMQALPQGSYLAIAHSSDGANSAAMVEAARRWNEMASPSITLRSPEQIARFFDGLELLEPGVVSAPFWRPETTDVGALHPVGTFAGIGRKPQPRA